jgi:ATP-dependent RNA helicase DDX27
MTERLAQYTDIRAALVVGGLSLNTQAAALRSRPEVVVATPARLVDHLHNTHSVGLDSLSALVLDEADRMLEIGFMDQVQQVVRACPSQRQTLLFSATLSEAVSTLAAMSLVNPAHLSADRKQSTPTSLTEEIVRVKPNQESSKEAMLLSLCKTLANNGRTIVFARTKVQAHRLKIIFGLFGLAVRPPPPSITAATLTRRIQEQAWTSNSVPFGIVSAQPARRQHHSWTRADEQRIRRIWLRCA